jgi:membrane-associated phospholipid phosphatase
MPEPAPNRRRLRAARQAVLLAALMGMSLSLYLVVLKWRGPSSQQPTRLDWEVSWVPFRPEWVWVYLLPYLVGPLAITVVSADTFAWYVRRALVLVFVSLVVFVIYPTRTVRPPVEGLGDGPTASLYRWMVEVDEPPANAAPSLHVSLTCLLAWAVVRDFPRWWPAAFGGAAVVWLATLLTHQHHFLDVVTGVLLASAVAWPWRKPRPTEPSG